jgi:hypothetical protein
MEAQQTPKRGRPSKDELTQENEMEKLDELTQEKLLETTSVVIVSTKILKGENKGEILKDKIIPKSVYDNNRIHLESQSQSMDFEYILNKEATLKHLTK